MALEVAMMGRLCGDQASLFYEFRVEDRIPRDHVLRRINVSVPPMLGDLRVQNTALRAKLLNNCQSGQSGTLIEKTPTFSTASVSLRRDEWHVPTSADRCKMLHYRRRSGPTWDSCTAANRRGTGPGYRSCAAEKAHIRFARDQLRGA
jgi:hypothetical protein